MSKKKKPPEITVRKLFKQFEALRVLLKVSIPDAAFMIGVTQLTYKNWKNHDTEPRGLREPRLREGITSLNKRFQESEKQS